MLKEDTTLVVVIVQLAIPSKVQGDLCWKSKIIGKTLLWIMAYGLSVYWTQIPVASWVWRADVEEG